MTEAAADRADRLRDAVPTLGKVAIADTWQPGYSQPEAVGRVVSGIHRICVDTDSEGCADWVLTLTFADPDLAAQFQAAQRPRNLGICLRPRQGSVPGPALTLTLSLM